MALSDQVQEARELSDEDLRDIACEVCMNRGTFRVQSVEEDVRVGDTCAIVTVNAGVCSVCGNRTYDGVNIRKLEDVRARLERGDVAGWRPVGTVYRA